MSDHGNRFDAPWVEGIKVGGPLVSVNDIGVRVGEGIDVELDDEGTIVFTFPPAPPGHTPNARALTWRRDVKGYHVTRGTTFESFDLAPAMRELNRTGKREFTWKEIKELAA